MADHGPKDYCVESRLVGMSRVYVKEHLGNPSSIVLCDIVTSVDDEDKLT